MTRTPTDMHRRRSAVFSLAGGRLQHSGFVAAVVGTALLASAAAHAHDTWFALRAAPQLPGNVVLALGTGNQFPQHEFAIASEYVPVRGCRQAGRELPLAALANSSTALLLNVRAPAIGPLTCWAQLVPFEVTLEADKIAVYLDEINASPALRNTWAAMQARGLRWTERYVKNARIEIVSAASTETTEAIGATGATGAIGATGAMEAQPAPLRMDVLLQGGLQPRRAGEPLAFQVLRNGLPLAGFAIELRGPATEHARWLRTDADGRAITVVPAAGRWVLRGTDLRLSTSDPDIWESDFVNLAFDVR